MHLSALSDTHISPISRRSRSLVAF